MARVAILGGDAGSLVNFRGDLIRDLVREKHIVFAIAPNMDSVTGLKISSFGAYPINCGFKRASTNPFGDFVSFIKLAKWLARNKCDIFVGYTIKPATFGVLAARWMGVGRVFAMITGLGYAFVGSSLKQVMVGFFVRRLYKISLLFANGVMFQNRDDLNLFQTLGILQHRRTVVIDGSGVNLDWFRYEPIVIDPIRFLMIGRLYREKGIYEYIEAVKIVKTIHPDVCFRLIGAPDANPNSLSKSDVENLLKGCIIEYLEHSDDVREHIRVSSVYVLPSYREGVPRSTLEAMAMGRPIITTDSPGCRETVVDGENGLLVAARDSRSLATAMLSLINKRCDLGKMGRKSREIVEHRFDVRLVNASIKRFVLN
jgi:glycosyltransferase involved in cell wall biosynthesis